MLEVEGINVYYGHIQALRDVTLHVDAGEVVALVGANGAGKTTTLRTISGILRPVTGHVTLDGQRIDRLRPEQIVEMGVAHLPEGRGIFPSLTVEENLRMGNFTHRRDKRRWEQGVEYTAELFPRLKERWGQAAGTMSGGEQQMLAMARALILQPRLLMIDELSLGLAPVIVQQLFETLETINKSGTTVLLVEQYVNLALKVAHRAYVLEKGTVAMSGTAQSLLEDSDLVRSSYLGGHGGAPDQKPATAKPAAKKKKASTASSSPARRRTASRSTSARSAARR